MDEKSNIPTKVADIAISAASALVGFTIGGPIGATIGGAITPTTKLAYQLVNSWNERRKTRIIKVVENAFAKSGKSDENILCELIGNSEWADSIILMIQQLMSTDPELDWLFTDIMASAIKTDDENERNRLLVLNSSIKGLNKIQLQIIRSICAEGGKLSATDISKTVSVPEIELRNAVRDLELRGMIIDEGFEPTVWVLRELGLAIAKTIDGTEENNGL